MEEKNSNHSEEQALSEEERRALRKEKRKEFYRKKRKSKRKRKKARKLLETVGWTLIIIAFVVTIFVLMNELELVGMGKKKR
ncbi:MAG: hypothetical protein HKN75_06375 [Bacteroidia bacterium]|nr:hypothetical protein [Bacteroidia bacterium]